MAGEVGGEGVMDIPRKGWDKAFALMHERGEDALLIDADVDLEVTEKHDIHHVRKVKDMVMEMLVE